MDSKNAKRNMTQKAKKITYLENTKQNKATKMDDKNAKKKRT